MIDIFLLLSVQIADLANEDTPQLYVACGRGPRSSLRVLRHGLEVRWEFFGSLMVSKEAGHRILYSLTLRRSKINYCFL